MSVAATWCSSHAARSYWSTLDGALGGNGSLDSDEEPVDVVECQSGCYADLDLTRPSSYAPTWSGTQEDKEEESSLLRVHSFATPTVIRYSQHDDAEFFSSPASTSVSASSSGRAWYEAPSSPSARITSVLDSAPSLSRNVQPASVSGFLLGIILGLASGVALSAIGMMFVLPQL